MEKTALINAPLSGIIARMGHGDYLVVADSGLPIPYGHQVVDLAVTPHLPRIQEVLPVILQELKVETVIITKEMEEHSPEYYAELQVQLGKLLPDVPVRKIPHNRFKEITRESGNIAFVRTGEATPYANLILVAGVVF
ncbi:MAG: D-ribose pyranase [Calditrichia bacterium]